MKGKTVSHYKITEKLGEGGMGEVYLAEDTTLKRQVAIKFFPSRISVNDTDKARFLQEAQAAAAINHPNVCVIHEIQEEEERQFIVMEFVEGQTLSDKITSKSLSMEQVIEYAIQIGTALQVAHEKGIVHRDIKSDNIMVTKTDQIKVMDFGLAKLRGSVKITKSTSTIGTLAYMAPEQIEGREIDNRADIFSFGVVLYEMLAWRRPFQGEYESALMYSILNEEPEPVQKFCPNISSELIHVLNRALEKDTGNRYQTMDDILIDLKRIKRDTSRVSQQISEIQPEKLRQEKRSKKWHRIIIPVAIVFVLVICFFLYKLFLSDKSLPMERRSIAVINFENQTGEEKYDYLQRAIPNLLITSLEQSEYLQVTTWQRLNDLLKQLKKEDLEVIDEDLGFQLCKMDGIEALVLGSYIKAGETFATDVKVIDVNSKQLLRSVSAKGEGIASILNRQIDELSQEISEGIGIAQADVQKGQLPVSNVTTSSMEAYEQYILGRNNFLRFFDKEAQKHLKRAVEIDTSFATAWLELSRVYRSLGNMEARDEALQKAYKFSVKATEREQLYIQAAYVYSFEQDYPKYLTILNKIAEKYPKEKWVYISLGSYFRQRMQFEDALEYIQKALTLDPEYGNAYNNLAYTYLEMKDYDKALESFQKYAALEPENPNIYDSMGELYYRQGNYEQATINFKKTIELKPDFQTANFYLSYIYALKEKYLDAIEQLDHYINAAPSSGLKGEAYMAQAFYYFWLGQIDKTIKLNQEASKLALAEGGVTYDAMNVWMDYTKNNFKSGVRRYLKILELTKKYWMRHLPFYEVDYNFYCGLIALKTGQIDSAKSKLGNIKKLIPDVLPIWKYLAQFRHNLLQAKILFAENEFTKVIEFCKNSPHIGTPAWWSTIVIFHENMPAMKDELAQAYYKTGQLDKAIDTYKKLIELKTNEQLRSLTHPKYHYRLAKLYEEKGLKDEALKEYQRFLELWKDADEDLPEPHDARARLTNLKQGN